MVTTRTVGHQMNEYEDTVFTDIEAKIKVKPVENDKEYDNRFEWGNK